MEQHNLQYQRKRKALLVLPLVIFVFATIGFVALGGGKTKAVNPTDRQGLNTELPDAQFDKHEKAKDKMSFYDQAKFDSTRQQSNNNNPLVQQFGFKNKPVTTTPSAGNSYDDPTVAKINQKLAQINQQVNQPQAAVQAPPIPANSKQMDAQVSRLEALMKGMKSDGPDPQMQQLSKMLAQIQAIQHPELVKKDTAKITENPFKAISALIDGNQKVMQGGAVRLKLNDSLTVKGQAIPKGTPVFGMANITNQRLLVEIKNIRLGNAIIPVSLVVYAEDGMPGVPAPEAELAGAAGTGADNAMQSMQLLSMDQSLATQAAAGGIEAAKSLFSKKVHKIKVHLKGGYPVLLRNTQIH